MIRNITLTYLFTALFIQLNAQFNINSGNKLIKDKKETVQFAAGQSAVTLTRTIEAEGSIEFKINAKKGQMIDFTVGYDFKNSDVEVYLQEPRLQNEIALSAGPKSPNEYKVTRAGVHSLYITNTLKKRITITLYLTLENPINTAPTPKPAAVPVKDKKETVQFAAGRSDVTLTRTIEAEGSIEFKIDAKKGQLIDFTVGYDFKDSDVDVYLQQPGLQSEIALSSGPKSPNEYKVTRAGVNSLFVNNTIKKKITITLYLILG